jgi:hypothetical protein
LFALQVRAFLISDPLIGKNWQLVTNEPVEFEKKLVDVQDFKKITDHFRGFYKINPNLIKEKWRMSTCDRLELQTLGSQPIMQYFLRAIMEVLFE